MTKFLLITALKANKLLTIFSCFFFVLFICLGIWQIERAAQKVSLLQEFKLQQAMLPTKFNKLSSEWSRVFIDGHYDPKKQILIDNQINKGKVGYKIFTPFYIDNKSVILVDRGWIAQGKSRNDLPEINFSSNASRVIGTLTFPERGFVAGDELLTNTWPKVSQSKSIEIVSAAFAEPILNKVLVLDPGSKFAVEHIPIKPFVITPEKHYGYAIQWFTMSIVLLVMLMYALEREKN